MPEQDKNDIRKIPYADYERIARRLRAQGYPHATALGVARTHARLISEIRMWAGPLRDHGLLPTRPESEGLPEPGE